jgi:DNA-binding transcriptional regulator YiaG
MMNSKTIYIDHLAALISRTIKEVRRGHGKLIPRDVARKVAESLWDETLPESHSSQAEWVLHIRTSLGFTQEELASVLETSQVTVARWESGANRPSRYYKRALERLAQSR